MERSLIAPDKPFRRGIIEMPTFTVTGDIEEAYRHLKNLYEPQTDTQSGPIKRITHQERLVDTNPHIADLLRNDPPSRYS